MLDVPLVLDQVGRQQLQQVFVPGLCAKGVDWVHDAAAHQAGPDAVGEVAGEPAVVAVGDQGSQLGKSLLRRGSRVDLAEV